MQYWRVMLKHEDENKAAECVRAGYIGVHTAIYEDIGNRLSGGWEDFRKNLLPIYMKNRPDKKPVGAGLALGTLWKVAEGMALGDIVLSPDGSPDGDKFYVGEISGDYNYAEGPEFRHRRPVKWWNKQIPRADMPKALGGRLGMGTVVNVSRYGEDIKQLLGNVGEPAAIAAASMVNTSGESAAAFALEKHLEEYLVKNWETTSLGEHYDIYHDDENGIAQQFKTDTGYIDILAVSKDKQTLLVVELKKGDATDSAVGQVLRYMGYVKSQLAEEGQQVRGAIIAASDDLRIKRALEVVDSVDFYRYELKFKIERD